MAVARQLKLLACGAKGGALIRVSFSGEDPILPEPRPKLPEREEEPDDTFYPDELPPDDF